MASCSKSALQLGELLRVLGRQVVRQTEVFLRVEELPLVFLKRRKRFGSPGRLVDDAREPAVVVDGAIAKHLEVLGGVAVWRVRVVGRVEHAHAVHRELLHAVDALGLGKRGGLEDRGSHVVHVMPLGANLALRPRSLWASA